jgi:hypothetical protein
MARPHSTRPDIPPRLRARVKNGVTYYSFVPGADLAQTAAWIAGGPFGIVSAMHTFRHLHRRRQE